MVEFEKKTPWFDSAKRVLFIYLLLSFFWIVVSDKLLSLIVSDKQLNLALQTYKGWVYVIVVGVFIYLERVTAIKRLSKVEEKYRYIIKNSNTAYSRMDKKGNLLDVNFAWLKMNKLNSKQEALGRNIVEFQIDDDRNEFAKLINLLLKGKKISDELSKIGDDGKVEKFIFSAYPVYSDGLIIGFEVFLINKEMANNDID